MTNESQEERNVAFGKALRKLRQDRNYSQEDMAGVIGVARTTYVEVEKGNRILDAVEISKLADNLEAPFWQILKIYQDQYVVEETNESREFSSIVLSNCNYDNSYILEEPDFSLFIDSESSDEVLKLNEIALYIMSKMMAHYYFGKSSLLIVLYLLNRDFSQWSEDSMLSASFIKTQKAVEVKELDLCLLARNGTVCELGEPNFQAGRKKYIPLRKVNKKNFNHDEKEFIDSYLEQIEAYGRKNLKQLVAKCPKWQSAEVGSVIS